jgi:hypothetical protein
MAAQRYQLADLVRLAFRGVTLGKGVGLRQGQGLDDYASAQTIAELRAMDEKEGWERISADELNRCHSSLSFFDAEGMRFHLPAYLVADLKGRLTQDLVFHLTYTGHEAMSRFDLLNTEQRAVVREFLTLRLADKLDFEREKIEQSLAGYWRED